MWSGIDGTLKLYIDGIEKWTGADTGDLKRDIVLGGILGLGQDPDTFGDSFDEREAFTGVIDEFRVWRYAKTGTDVATTHALGVKPDDPKKDKLLVHLTFDDPWTAASDKFDFSSFGNILKAFNGGDADPLLLGQIPPKNEMRYVTARKTRRPSRPRFVASTVPLLTSYHPVANVDDSKPTFALFAPTSTYVDVYLNVHNSDTSLAIKVNIESAPTHGKLYLIQANGAQGSEIFADGQVVNFPDNTWCRTDSNFPSASSAVCPYRVRYVPNSVATLKATKKDQFKVRGKLASEPDTTKTYIPGTSSVALTAHVVYDTSLLCPPVSGLTFNVSEDTATPIALGGLTAGGANIPAAIMAPPSKGTLYEVTFEAGKLTTYSNIVRSEEVLSKTGKKITTFPHRLNNDRSVVVYAPAKDANGARYAELIFSYINSDSSYTDCNGTAVIHVDAVNDAPNKDLTADDKIVCFKTYAFDPGACYLDIPSGGPSNIKLNSTDIDVPASPSGSPRNYQRITTWPKLGTLYQVTPGGEKGAEIVPSPVAYTTTFASSVRNASSQKTMCDAVKTKCTIPFLCNPAADNPACTSTKYHSSNLAGPRPTGGVNAWREAAFAFSEPSAGIEIITLEIGPNAGDAYYLESLVLTEAAYPGAVVGISVASEYKGDIATEWRDIYRLSVPEGHTGHEWREFTPPICPVPVKAAFVKIEVDTRNTPNAHELFSSLQVRGSKVVPPGLVLHEDKDNLYDYGRIMYVPNPGIHATKLDLDVFDTLAYSSSDCAAVSPAPMPVKLKVNGPDIAAKHCGVRTPDACDWLTYAEGYGYIGKEEHFVEPDTVTRLFLNTSAAIKSVWDKLQVSRSVCKAFEINADVRLQWERNRATTTTLKSVHDKPPWGSGGDLKTDGTSLSKLNSMNANSTCPTSAASLPVFAIDVTAAIKDQGRFELDYWSEFQPETTVATRYTTRHRINVRMMCSVNATHIHRFDGKVDPKSGLRQGNIVPRTRVLNMSTPLYMRQPSWERASDGMCVGCHQVPATQIQTILADAEMQAHFEKICEVRFKKCDAGQYFDEDYFKLTGLFRCHACPQGTYQSSSNRQPNCNLCPRGTYFPNTGATQCLSCREFWSIDSYQDKEGAHNCTYCPKLVDIETGEERSTNVLNLTNPDAGTRADHCVCKVGYYHPEKQVGMPCQPCPDGAFCAGGRVQPVPCGAGIFENVIQENLAAGKNITKLLRGIHPGVEGTQVALDGSINGSSLVVQQIIKQGVDLEAFCRRDEGFWGDPRFPLEFYQCDHCVGGVQFACDEKHQGRLCEKCADGYYRVGDDVCSKCPGSKSTQVLLQFAAVIFVLLLWYLMTYMVCSDYEQVDIFFTFLQVAALVQTFDVKWPSTVAYNFLHVVFGLFNLDVDFVQPNCLMNWGYTSSFYLQLGLPLGVMVLCFMLYAWMKLVNNVHMSGSMNNISKLIRYMTKPIDDDGLSDFADVIMKRYVTYAIITYSVVTVKCFEPFMCTRLPNGEYFLNAGPDVTCWSDDFFTWHSGLVAAAVAGIFLYVIGIPLVIVSVLGYGYKYNFLAHPRFLKVFGFLYTKFDVEYFWWEITFLLRRFFICLLAVFFEGSPSSQIAIAMLFIVLNIAAHSYARPFRKGDMDIADAVGLISISFYLISTMLFNCFKEMEPYQYTAVEVLTLILVWGTIVALFLIGLNDARKVSAGHSAEALMHVRMLAALEGVGLAYREMGDDPAKVFAEADVDKTGELDIDEFKKKLKEIDPEMDDRVIEQTFQLVDEDGSGTVSYAEFRKHMWRRYEPSMDGSAMGPLDKLKQWIRRLFCMKSRQDDLDIAQKAFQDAIKAKMTRTLKVHNTELVGELVNTFQPEALYDFAKLERHDDNIVKFHQVDAWLSPIVSDDSHVSAWSLTAEAVFFRNLVQGSPFLIDWLLTSSKEDKLVFQKMVSSFMACQNVVGHKGVYGRLVRREDRAPIVYWLKEATSAQHLTLWEVMDAILIASANENSFIPRMIRPPTVADDWGVDIDLEEVLEGIKGVLPKLAAAAKRGDVNVDGALALDLEAGATLKLATGNGDSP